MKFNRKKKKGFTIVELVIVIAVIAVLAAVLIPTFISLTNKANKASDQALVKNLNTALATQEQVSGDTKNNTMHDAVEDLKEYGYLLPNLVTKSDEKLLWDRTTNRFLLEEDASAGKTLDYWRIQDNLNEQKYNVYAGAKFAIDDANLTALKVGFDAGYTEGIESIQYLGNGVSAQEVVIRTNDTAYQTELNINAPLDVVKHYGYLTDLDISAIASASYHEFGKLIGKATISQGHIVVEKGSEVPQVTVVNASTPVIITANEGTVVIADSASSSHTNVVTNSEKVYISGVSESNVSGEKKSSAKLSTVVNSLANLKTAIAAGGMIDLGVDLAVTETISVAKTAVLNLNGHNLTVDSSLSSNCTSSADTSFIFDVAETGDFNIVGSGRLSGYSVIMNVQGKATVNGGTFVTKVLTGNASSHSQIIVKPTGSLVVNEAKMFTAKSAIYNGGEAVINNAYIVNISAQKGFFADPNKYETNPFGYTLISSNKMTVNNVEIIAIHGGIAVNNGETKIENANVDVTYDALDLYKTVNTKVWHVGHYEEANAVDLSTMTIPTSGSYLFYALYCAGEIDVNGTVVNGGTFHSNGVNCVHIGNKSDGGAGKYATITINGGTFTGGTSGLFTVVASSANNYGLGYATINGGKYGANMSGYQGVNSCVQGSDGLWVVNQ